MMPELTDDDIQALADAPVHDGKLTVVEHDVIKVWCQRTVQVDVETGEIDRSAWKVTETPRRALGASNKAVAAVEDAGIAYEGGAAGGLAEEIAGVVGEIRAAMPNQTNPPEDSKG